MANTKLVADILQNISVQNVNKAFVYITYWTSPLKRISFFNDRCVSFSFRVVFVCMYIIYSLIGTAPKV